MWWKWDGKWKNSDFSPGIPLVKNWNALERTFYNYYSQKPLYKTFFTAWHPRMYMTKRLYWTPPYLSLSKSCSCDPGSGCTTNWSCGAEVKIEVLCCWWGLGDGGEGLGGPRPTGGGGGVILAPGALEDSVEALLLLCPMEELSWVLDHWPKLLTQILNIAFNTTNRRRSSRSTAPSTVAIGKQKEKTKETSDFQRVNISCRSIQIKPFNMDSCKLWIFIIFLKN